MNSMGSLVKWTISSRFTLFARVGVVALFTLIALDARAGTIYVLSDGSGLAAEAEFSVVGGSGSTLEIRLKNRSSGVPGGFDASDQLLTGISWDFGAPGMGGDVEIVGGSVVIGSSSASMNFDLSPPLGPGADVSGEYGFGNMAGTGALTNFVSTVEALATPFGGANLDGPVELDGPQSGLHSSAEPLPLGGLGAIQDEILITLLLDGAITQASLDADLAANGVRVEFGSDAFFINVPEASTALCLALGIGWLGIRRRARESPSNVRGRSTLLEPEPAIPDFPQRKGPVPLG